MKVSVLNLTMSSSLVDNVHLKTRVFKTMERGVQFIIDNMLIDTISNPDESIYKIKGNDYGYNHTWYLQIEKSNGDLYHYHLNQKDIIF